MKKSSLVFIIIIIFLALAVIYVFSENSNGIRFTTSNFERDGVSLFYDTLETIGHPVGVSRSPLSLRTNMDHAYIIIQPIHPPMTFAHGEEILEWVENGGRLIFLHNSTFNVFDSMLSGTGRRIDSLMVYSVGMGEVVTGRAYQIGNYHMMNDPSTGQLLEAILWGWNVDQIWFAEYYHFPSQNQNFINTLPVILRLLLAQIGLISFFVIWHLGKSFGRPVPYYEEMERKENEHIYALARLYEKVKK